MGEGNYNAEFITASNALLMKLLVISSLTLTADKHYQDWFNFWDDKGIFLFEIPKDANFNEQVTCIKNRIFVTIKVLTSEEKIIRG